MRTANPSTTALAFALLAIAGGAQAQTPQKLKTSAPVASSRAMVAAPANVTVTGAAQTATITWAAVANAASYRVLRSTDPNTPGQDLTQPITATTYFDPGVTPGQTVYYIVVAVSAAGMTGASAPVAYSAPAALTKIAKPTYQKGGMVPPPAPSPPPVTPVGTSVVPALALPGATVRVLGQGFSALTAVRSGTTNLTWAPVSDTEFTLTLPSTTGLFGSQPLAVSLIHNVAGVAPGSIQPPPNVLYPPKILELSRSFAECCELVAVRGIGFTGSGMSVTVGGVSAQIMGSASGGVSFRLPLYPTNDPGGPKPVVVQTAGGSASSPVPLTVVTGPSYITSITPDTIPRNVPTLVTVHGVNLFRAAGLCIPGTGRPVTRADLPQGHRTGPTSNDQMTVMVEVRSSLAPLTGPVALVVPPTVPTGERSYSVSSSSSCQANPTAVNITVP